MKYSKAQAATKANQIYSRFAGLIHEACVGSIVPEGFLGGFTGVEAGIDHSGRIDPNKTRFEPGVYHHLLAVRDGLLPAYNHIHRSDLAGMDDAAIRNLATSFGLTQIMGWHMVHDLVGTIEDLRDLKQHLHYCVQLLVIDAKSYLAKDDFESVLRIWNSGSANGKTYDPDYVHNALAVKEQYELLIEAAKDSAAEPPADVPPVTKSSEPTEEEPAETPKNQALPPTQDFVPAKKTVNAPAADGSTKTATNMTIAGIVLPGFVVAIIQAVKELIAQGFLDSKEIGNTVIDLIKTNQKYALMLIGGFLAYLLCRKAFKQITLWIQMFINAVPHWHDIEVKKQ